VQTAAATDEAIAASYDGNVACGRGAGGGRSVDGTGEVATDHGFGLDQGLVAEHDFLRADKVRIAGHLVARVLRRNSQPKIQKENSEPRVKRTVSMYSHLGVLLDILVVLRRSAWSCWGWGASRRLAFCLYE